MEMYGSICDWQRKRRKDVSKLNVFGRKFVNFPFVSSSLSLVESISAEDAESSLSYADP